MADDAGGAGPDGPRAPRDAGLTLVELLVALAVMSVVMTMFTTAVLQIHRSTRAIESAAAVQSQMEVVFDRLDGELRYASAISVETAADGDPVARYRAENTGVPVCTELRLHRADRVADQQLQRRTWEEGAGATDPTPWTPLASGVDGAQPFTLVPADATYQWHRLTIDVTVTSGGGDGSAGSKRFRVGFTALNTSAGTSGADVCAAGTSSR
jgi:prepilin-type N-terminal cleavage/methylation domain-containing protein